MLRYFEEQATLANSQLRWTGHVAKMCEDRVHGSLAEGRRCVIGQKLKYKDVAKYHMKYMNIDVDGWEELAADGTKWRSALHRGKEVIKQKIMDASNQSHYRSTTLGPTSANCAARSTIARGDSAAP